MKALVYHGPGSKAWEEGPRPTLLADTDAIVGVEEISQTECRELLAAERVGRLGVVVEGRPDVFPVNYSLDAAGAVLVETAPGTKLAAAVNHHVVFEVDRTSAAGAESGSGWSVVVHGVAQQTDPASLRLAGRRYHSWLADRPFTLRIHPNRITGRRLSGGKKPSVKTSSPCRPAKDGTLTRACLGRGGIQAAAASPADQLFGIPRHELSLSGAGADTGPRASEVDAGPAPTDWWLPPLSDPEGAKL